MTTTYYCNKYEREVELYENYCIGCSLYPFNVGKCPFRTELQK